NQCALRSEQRRGRQMGRPHHCHGHSRTASPWLAYIKMLAVSPLSVPGCHFRFSPPYTPKIRHAEHSQPPHPCPLPERCPPSSPFSSPQTHSSTPLPTPAAPPSSPHWRPPARCSSSRSSGTGRTLRRAR